MNKQEALFFEALSKDNRSEIVDVLERRAVRGYKASRAMSVTSSLLCLIHHLRFLHQRICS